LNYGQIVCLDSLTDGKTDQVTASMSDQSAHYLCHDSDLSEYIRGVEFLTRYFLCQVSYILAHPAPSHTRCASVEQWGGLSSSPVRYLPRERLIRDDMERGWRVQLDPLILPSVKMLSRFWLHRPTRIEPQNPDPSGKRVRPMRWLLSTYEPIWGRRPDVLEVVYLSLWTYWLWRLDIGEWWDTSALIANAERLLSHTNRALSTSILLLVLQWKPCKI